MVDTFSTISTTLLPETSFIGGTYKELTFDVFDSAGSPVDISSFTYTWILSPYGQPEITTISKTGVFDGTATDKNRFIVYLYSGDTVELSGKYIQQPVITGTPGFEFRLSQGLVSITPASSFATVTEGATISAQITSFTTGISASIVSFETEVSGSMATISGSLVNSSVNKRHYELTLNTSASLVTTNMAIFRIPSLLNGWYLSEVTACCSASSTSGSPQFSVSRISASATDGTGVAMLTSNVYIAQGGYDSSLSGSTVVISTSASSVATGNRIKIATVASGSSVTYATVSLVFQNPV